RENIVELGRSLADQMRKHLPLLLAGEIRAWRRSGQIELRCIARMVGHEYYRVAAEARFGRPLTLRGPVASSKAICASARRARPQRGRPGLRIDQHGADDNVMQQPPPSVKKSDQEDKGREHADADPKHCGMHRAENELSRRAIPTPHHS